MNNILKTIHVFTNNFIAKILLGSAKFLSVGAFLLMLPLAVQAKQPEYQTRIQADLANPSQMLSIPEKRVEVYSVGSREDLNAYDPEAIKGFMKFYGEKYGLDWKLVYAIGYHESGNYTSSLARTQNNFFGRKAAGGGYASWNTPEEGIENEFIYLKTRYFDQGLTTPASINRVYAEDQSWHLAVSSVMAQL